ncbi:phage tail tube protein [Endothiovibrio diazotrophicus]
MLMFTKKLLMAGLEDVSYNTEASSTAAVRTSNLVIQPLEGSTVKMNYDRPYMGSEKEIHVGTHVGSTFDVAVAGSGTAGIAPAYGTLLRACGMEETVTDSVDAVYKPRSNGHESMTQFMYFDGQKHSTTGCRGSVKMSFTAGATPTFSFTMKGLWKGPLSEGEPATDFSPWIDPLPVEKDNTTTFRLFGQDLNMHELEIDLGNQVAHRNVVNSEGVIINERLVTGRVVFDAEALSTFNPFTQAKNNASGTLELVHGTTGGNIVQVDAPIVQLLQPKYGEKDGVRTIEANLTFIPTTGDDELTVTIL